MGPQNAVMGGDANYGMDMPQTEMAEPDLSRERNMARFSRTREFQALKEVVQQRIQYHTKYSPGSQGETAFRDMPNEERGWRSLAADLVIEELTLLINAYETANQVVADAEKAKRQQQRKSAEGSAVSGPAGA